MTTQDIIQHIQDKLERELRIQDRAMKAGSLAVSRDCMPRIAVLKALLKEINQGL